MTSRDKVCIVLWISQLMVGMSARADTGVEPNWKHKQIVRVQLSDQGAQRKSGSAYTSFYDGRREVISGEELFDLVDPEGDVEQGIAVLALARILDHEAVKHRMATQVSEDRVSYVVHSILVQNAANLQKMKVRAEVVMIPDTCKPGPRLDQDYEKCRGHSRNVIAYHPLEDISAVGSDEYLYGLLRSETIGTEPNSFRSRSATFNIDWKFREGGLAFELQRLQTSKDELRWPKVSLVIGNEPDPEVVLLAGAAVRPSFPLSLQEFKNQIRRKLQTVQTGLVRAAVLQKLLQERVPPSSEQAFGVVTREEMDQMYRRLLQGPASPLGRLQANILEINAVGVRAIDFRTEFLRRLTETEKDYLRAWKEDPQHLFTDADEERLNQYAARIRQTVPSDIYRKLLVEFSSDIKSGKLGVSMEKRALSRRQTDSSSPLAADLLDAKEMNYFFFVPTAQNPFPPVESLLFHFDGVDFDGSVRIAVLESREQSLEARDSPETQQILRKGVLAEKRQQSVNKILLNLLSQNHVEIMTNTCAEPGWPCLDVQPRVLVPHLMGALSRVFDVK
ncbi:hypothetical protein WDW37_17055 [Bdellovibrionota bacterium FG-1]